MTEELLQALRTVINYLDEQMNEQPSRELADISNYLENIIQKNKS